MTGPVTMRKRPAGTAEALTLQEYAYEHYNE
jgi:hypothetical protein